MCFYYSIDKKNATKLIKHKIVSDKQLDVIENKKLVNGFQHPQMQVITNDNPELISLAKWGLIPSWIKSTEAAKKIIKNTLNAKSETIFEKSSFKESIKHKRCLVFCSGFYEWQKVNKKKYPYFISLKDDEIFVLAGIWSEWDNPLRSEKIKTYSIITVEANELVSEIHNEKKRMPLLLEYENAKEWLRCSLNENDIKAFFKPYNHLEMKAHPIKHFLNSSNKAENITEYYQYPELIYRSYKNGIIAKNSL